jgi:hypothetical protein
MPDRLTYLVAAHLFEATPDIAIDARHRAAGALSYVAAFVRVHVRRWRAAA